VENDYAEQNSIENNYKHKLETITRHSRNPYTTYAQRNYSQKDVLSVPVTEVSDAVDGGGKNACKVWLEKVLILVNSSSSAKLQRSSNICTSDSDFAADVHSAE